MGNAIPGLVDRLVYISAWSCVQRANPIEYMQEPEFADNLLGPLYAFNVGDPAQLGVGRANYRTADVELLDALKAATLADVSDEQFRAFLNILQPDESIAVMTADARVDADTWGTIPRTYIRLSGDRTLPVAMQDRLIAEADALTPGNPYDPHTMDTSHVGFLFRADEVAAILDKTVIWKRPETGSRGGPHGRTRSTATPARTPDSPAPPSRSRSRLIVGTACQHGAHDGKRSLGPVPVAQRVRERRWRPAGGDLQRGLLPRARPGGGDAPLQPRRGLRR
ncbi:hypothetical protein [Nonomuraea sp. NPDC005501]|uniref:hypothetical protein n=1 Tax=Nonomuraea sp. NPDC005501 TaxID=3156884 RepID=UPI0033A335A1